MTWDRVLGGAARKNGDDPILAIDLNNAVVGKNRGTDFADGVADTKPEMPRGLFHDIENRIRVRNSSRLAVEKDVVGSDELEQRLVQGQIVARCIVIGMALDDASNAQVGVGSR